MGRTIVFAALVVVLAACGGSGGSSPLPAATQPPNFPVTNVYFHVVQSDAVTPAVGVPVYVNMIANCAVPLPCNLTLTTDGTGSTHLIVEEGPQYCISLHNVSVSPSTVPATPIYVTGFGPLPYLESDTCMAFGANQTIYLAE